MIGSTPVSVGKGTALTHVVGDRSKWLLESCKEDILGLAEVESRPDELYSEATGDLSQDSILILRRLQTAISRMLSFAPGGICKSRDLEKLLGVDVKLSWQIFRFIGPGDILSLSPHIPTAKSLRRLCDSALRHGVGEKLVDDVQRAYAQYESLVERHADDRLGFESILSSLDGNQTDPQVDLNHRKAIFMGHRHYWGTQMQAYIVSQFVHPNVNSGLCDIAHLRSRYGLRRLRANAEIFADSYKLVPQGGGDDRSSREHFDEKAAAFYGAPVLPAFSTRPLPAFRASRAVDGSTRTQLTGDTIGRTSSVDMTFGHISRNVPVDITSDGSQKFGMGVRITIPMTSVTINCFIHHDAYPDVESRYEVYGHAGDRDQVAMSIDGTRLPFREKIAYLGRGIEAARNREVLQYANLLEYACQHNKWNPADFDVFSLRVDYPLLDTMFNLEFISAVRPTPASSETMFGDFI